MSRHFLIATLLLLSACDLFISKADDATRRDGDGDGSVGADDCDDGDPSVAPGAVEVCDGVDQDCNGVVDDGATDGEVFYADADHDGVGDAEVRACDRPAGTRLVGGDCNDADPTVFPGANESCDGVDEDCDGQVDDGAPAGPDATEVCGNGVDDDCDGSTDEGVPWFADADADGYGAGAATVACTAPSGAVADEGDCDDAVAAIHPGATELCNLVDDDCDGHTDDGVPHVYWFDADGDGFGGGTWATACARPIGFADANDDCDDIAGDVFPGAPELCDGLDNDCDLQVDDGAVGDIRWYADSDGDGHGVGAGVLACVAPPNTAAASDDCDDTDGGVFPGATESCDGIDDDCDGGVDERGSVGETGWYTDLDADAHGAGTPSFACTAPPGAVAAGDDCDDADAAVFPGATELCDDLDQDCTGTADDGLPQLDLHADADGDGSGAVAIATTDCAVASGLVLDGSDCDDADPNVHPGAPEQCNAFDDDCDAAVDEAGASGEQRWYLDADADGYGLATDVVTACAAVGRTLDAADCDDTVATVYPGAPESCDGVDDDCDGQIDDQVVVSSWYADADGDGFGAGTATVACAAPSGTVASNTDCNDAAAAIHPGATEACNTVDDDCDGLVDEGLGIVFYRDADGDGFGTTPQLACSVPTGFAAMNGDCDDSDALSHPGATEACNGHDDDCDAGVDEAGSVGEASFYADGDGDGYGVSAPTVAACTVPVGFAATADDCADADVNRHPGATEGCNSLDDDCDTLVDEPGAIGSATYYADTDADSYGNPTSTVAMCTVPSGYVANSTDCDDTRATVHPGATETCNGRDDDCDTTIDEGVLTTYHRDADSDAYGSSAVTTQACAPPTGYILDLSDCNDAVAAIHPGATEVCNAVDDDCDGQVDEAGAVGATTRYYDGDADGYGAPGTGFSTCGTGGADNDDDCDDVAAASHPGAVEVCDELDNDCNLVVDDGGTPLTWYQDFDGDGWGNVGQPIEACAAPGGYVAQGDDCDDEKDWINPGLAEICDGYDNDCDGLQDEGFDPLTYYYDYDLDGHGNLDNPTVGCTPPDGFVDSSDDCDDSTADVYPGHPELCDGYDNDCTGSVDDGLPIFTYWFDVDRDGAGDDSRNVLELCEEVDGGQLFVPQGGDCNDADILVFTGAAELCDGVDNDCDGAVDDDTVSVSWYLDADGDHFGVSGFPVSSCARQPGYAPWLGDCDDFDPTVYFDAPEACDHVDNNCDSVVDEGITYNPIYRDADGDAIGELTASGTDCNPPSGYSFFTGDCDDSDPTIHANGFEVCNDGIDQDCDGSDLMCKVGR